MWLDIIRIAFLVVVACLYISEAATEACRNRFTLAVFTRIMVFVVCFVCFIMEAFFISMQTPTTEVLAKDGELIDFSSLVYNY
mmetsp:Transcript_30768/g.40902  ORF Transcript_30768/g.40902 Transcript_30768/m.40902 type:complete len:83 (+) Transcript_30768:1898-2146(+)